MKTIPHRGAGVRFPLFLKILLWFFLNVLSLIVLAYLMLGVRLGISLDAMLMGAVGERLRSVAEVIGRDLRTTPQPQWDNVLEKFSESYEVTFGLYAPGGVQIAGEPMELPREVVSSLARPERDMPGMPGRMKPPPPRAADGPMFMRRAGFPKHYWVGMPIHVRPPGRSRGMDRPSGAILVVRSETLSGHGLLVDIRPWLWTGAGALVFSVLFWFPLVRGITRSIGQMTEATGRIASGEFDVAVDAGRSDELGRLGGSINRMADRLHGFVAGQRRFLGDIAHELCTPIARTKMALGALEVRTPPEHRDYIRDADEEMEQMSAMVNELLSFSKASLARQETELEPVNLRAIVEQIVAREAPDARMELDVPDTAAVLAEPGLLSRALANVLRNAVRYAGAQGPIRIAACSRGAATVVTIADSGPGVPHEALPHLFDPFYRPEAARTRESGGTGLGLAIVRTCMEACRGSVVARNASPCGFEVEITLATAHAG